MQSSVDLVLVTQDPSPVGVGPDISQGHRVADSIARRGLHTPSHDCVPSRSSHLPSRAGHSHVEIDEGLGVCVLSYG